MWLWALSLLLSMLFSHGAEQNSGPGLNFVSDFPEKLPFSNSTGAKFECQVQSANNLSVNVSWVLVNGMPVLDVPDLRKVDGGLLEFLPFSAEKFRPDIHSTVYRCVASNSMGTIRSTDVFANAVVDQNYDTQVYDVYTIEGNVAVLKCHVPSVLSDYVKTVAWIKNNNLLIKPTLDDDGKYAVIDSGFLHIRDVNMTDTNSNYKCKTENVLTGETKISPVGGRLIVTESQTNVMPKLITNVFTFQVSQGENYAIPCVGQGVPAPKLRWFRKNASGQILEIEGKSRIFQTRSSLVFKNADRSDAGVYICELFNSNGKTQAEFSLNVIQNVSVNVTPKVNVAKVGEVVTFKCEANDIFTMFGSWYHNGVSMGSPFTPILTVTANVASQGFYQCVVKNEKSTAQSISELKLSEFTPYFEETFSEVSLKPGASLNLKCIAVGIPEPTFSWMLEESLLNNSRISISSSKDARGRIVSTLKLNRLKVEDGGLYSCVVENDAGVSRHSSRISINGPLTAKKSVKIIAIAGQNAYLNCPVYGAPIEETAWTDSSNASLVYMSQYKVFSNGTLLIKDAHRPTNDRKYFCTVKNSLGQTAISSVTVEVVVLPKILPFRFGNLLYEGSAARVVCGLQEGDLPIHFAWLHNGFPVGNDVSVHTMEGLSSILVIEKLTFNHSGTYTCVARNMAGETRHEAVLNVNVPPRWLKQPKGVITALNGEKMMIDCQSEGYPKPKIEWTFLKSGETSGYLINNEENRRVLNNGSLFINSILTENQGIYVCKASNGIGRPLEAVVEVKINAPPFIIPELENLRIAIGKNVQWQCTVHGDKPIEIKWQKHGKPLMKSNDNRIITQTINHTFEIVSTLTIHKVLRDDAGPYQCTAKNVFGSTNSTSILTVIEPPEAPVDLKVLSQSSDNVEIDWKVKFNGNEAIKKYIIQYKKAKDVWENAITMETVNGEPTNSIIANLNAATTYNFRIFAENNVGRSLSSQILEIITDEDVPSGAPLDVQVESANAETLKIEWKAPEEKLWNGKILGFSVGFKAADSEEPYSFKTLLTPNPLANPHSILISGMKQFAKYLIVVQAYTSKGKGPLSEPIIAMTSEGAPTLAPSDVRCTTLTSQSIHITWSEPSADSVNGILRAYKVSFKTVSDLDDGKLHHKTVNLSSFTLQNLEKYSNYSIQVSAMTKTAEGPKSAAIYCKTLDDVPDAPVELKAATASETSVTISWKASERKNGIIKSHTLYFRESGSTKEPNARTVSAEVFYYEVTSLQKETSYEFWVTSTTLAGEGSPSLKIKQNTMGPNISAKIVSFGDKIMIGWKQDVNLQCLVVGSPKPMSNWAVNGKMIETGGNYLVKPDGSLDIKNIQESHSGNYVCTVVNSLGEDRISYSVTVLSPPSSPIIDVNSVSPSSIDISWNIPASKLVKIKGYIIQVRKESGEWREINVESEIKKYKFENLECGNRYEIIMLAFNQIGIGAPSDVVIVATNGSVPAPPVKSDLIEESTNSISLYLNTWRSNGCPIMYYSVEYAPRSSNEWTLIASDIKPMQRRIVIPNLKSGTWYGLRMTAFNSAGSYVAEYNFATLTNVGATISTEYQADSASEEIDGLMTYLNFYLVVPIICTFIVLLAIVGAACFYIKMKKREQKRSRAVSDLDNQMSIAGTLRPGARSGSFSYMQRRNFNPNDHGQISEDELAPYATFQLGNNIIETMNRRGKVGKPGVPLPPPPRFEGFPGSGIQDLQPASSNQATGPIETTFFFPHFQNEENLPQAAVGIQYPTNNYPQQGENNLLFN